MIRTYPCHRCKIQVSPSDEDARSIFIGEWIIEDKELPWSQKTDYNLCGLCFRDLGEFMAGVEIFVPEASDPRRRTPSGEIRVNVIRNRGIYGSTGA